MDYYLILFISLHIFSSPIFFVDISSCFKFAPITRTPIFIH